MKKWIVVLTVIILSVVTITRPSNSYAASLSGAEKLVQQAEDAAGALKWEISLEYRKSKYSKDPITYPDMEIYNATKNARLIAYNAIKSLPAQEQSKLTKRMESNVDIHFSRTMAYIDAITSGRKIIQKTEDFYHEYGLNPISDRSEETYHALSAEIRKQAILLYRVYGRSTRDAILDKYKSPGENARQSSKHVISAKIEMDNLYRSIENNESKEDLLFSVEKIESIANQINNENTKQLLHAKIDEAYTIIQGNRLPTSDYNDSSVLPLKELIKLEKSVVMVLAYDENNEILSQGSGFVVGKSAILTNYHVVEGASKLEAITFDGSIMPLDGVASFDYDYDYAILKPQEPLTLSPLKLGKLSMVEKGDSIVTIGSPEGLLNTISTGIISGLRSSTLDGSEFSFIQFTAPISFGSSGGPLLNMQGYVVGINTLGYDLGNLNFALPIDIAIPAISNVNLKSHSSITVIPYNELPVTDDNDVIEEDVGADSETPINESFLYLSDSIREAVIHPSQPIIYALNENKDVLEMNYETGEIRRLTMSLVPEKIYFANNELFVTLLKGSHSPYWWNEYQEGAIGIIDTDTFTIEEQFDIDMDPYDIVSDGKSIYVSSGSGQWTYIKGYSRETLLETSKIGSIYHGSLLEIHPNLDKLYVIDTPISPRDVEVHSIADGKLVTGYDSPYHGDYQLNTNMTISPDGKYIFNGSGVIMTASDSKEMNMKYVTKLYVPFEEITFNLDQGYFYTSQDNSLDIYNYDTLERVKRYEMSGDIRKMFYQNGKLVIISLETLYSSKLPKYAIKTYKVEGNKVIE